MNFYSLSSEKQYTSEAILIFITLRRKQSEIDRTFDLLLLYPNHVSAYSISVLPLNLLSRYNCITDRPAPLRFFLATFQEISHKNL